MINTKLPVAAEVSGLLQEFGTTNPVEISNKNENSIFFNNDSKNDIADYDFSGVESLEDILGENYLEASNPEEAAICAKDDTNTDSINGLNGKLDEKTSQGYIGDCWLLAGLNSLNSTEAGAKILSDAININAEDKTATVNFKGVDKSYTFTFDEINKARKETVAVPSNTSGLLPSMEMKSKYSTGDNDMLLFELATEKFLNELKDEKITLPEDAPEFLSENDREKYNNPIDGGRSNHILYLLTGQEGKEVIDNSDDAAGAIKELDTLIDTYNKNEGKFQATFGFRAQLNSAYKNSSNANSNNGIQEIKDVTGKTIRVTGGANHAWSLKSIKDDVFTIVNPWNSTEEISVPKKELEKYLYSVSYSVLD